MKFAKYLEENCISEWKDFYFDYKKGKKLIKRVHVKKRSSQVSGDRAEPRDAHDSAGSGTPLVGPQKTSKTQHYGAIEGAPLNRQNSSSGSSHSDGEQEPISPAIPQPAVTSSSISHPPKLNQRTGLVGKLSRWATANLSSEIQVYRPQDVELAPENEAQETFYIYVENEIRKIDKFYEEREADADKRLHDLRYQLREMKERKKLLGSRRGVSQEEAQAEARSDYTRTANRWAANVKSLFSYADSDLLNLHPIADSAKSESATQLVLIYRVARRRLRIAIQEFYHSLELLQAYRTLNRTALTKALKKYDKISGAKAGPAFLRTFNHKTYIGTSDFLDKIMHDSEDVFAKYYYHGDRKHAVTALRTKQHTEDYRFTMMRVGIYFGLALPLALEGIVRSQVAFPDDAQRTYLLQVFAGFFFLLLTCLLFGLNAYLWTRSKINYSFIFELNVRHNLNWIQYLELPAFCAFLFSLIFWLCFSDFFPNFTIWYPLLFLCLILAILFLPAPTLHYSTRRWLITAHARLLVSGFSSVRFQDVFLGDLYNSLTYSMGNLALFFCLYRFDWQNPAQCGSGHSMLLGFFQTLPGIVRLLQCSRRFYDTRHYFPHLINAGKYTFTILTYTTLSVWRIHQYDKYMILYICFATINSVYTATWDIVMDVSLLQPGANPFLLRTHRAFGYTWVYYVFLITDPILRFSWIFYIIYSDDVVQAAALSFYIGLAEIIRRTIWSAFRVENEHVTNVSTYRATRELPLPFSHRTDSDIESQQRRSGSRTRTGKEQPRIAEAHATDFERKSINSLHFDDVAVDSALSDDDPPSDPDTPEDSGQEQETS